MAQLETISLSHLPSTLPVHVALYRDVQNAAFLKQQLLAGNSEYEYALIDASMVCDPCQFEASGMHSVILMRKHRCYQDYMRLQPSSELSMTT